MRAWSVRLVRLRRTRVPSGVASSADRARARRRQRAFLLFANSSESRQRHLRSSVLRNAAGRACRRFVCHVSGRVCRRSRLVRDAVSCQWHKKKLKIVRPIDVFFFCLFSRTFFATLRVSREGAFFRRHFCGIFRVPAYASAVSSFRASCPEYLWSGRQRSRTQRRAGSACDSTRARTTPHTHRRR